MIRGCHQHLAFVVCAFALGATPWLGCYGTGDIDATEGKAALPPIVYQPAEASVQPSLSPNASIPDGAPATSSSSGAADARAETGSSTSSSGGTADSGGSSDASSGD